MNESETNLLLFKAISAGDLDQVRIALDSGADIHAFSVDFNRKPIYNACGHRHYHIVQLLLERGASPQDGLMAVAIQGNIELLQLLIEHGADINTKLTDEGHTLLHIACDFNHQNFIKYALTLENIQLDPKTSSGKTPYDYLKRFGMDEEIKAALKKR